MRTCIGVHRWQLACEAAVLPDEEAPLFLREQLDSFPDDGRGFDVPLTALAWFDAESALEYYDAAAELKKPDRNIPRAWLEAYAESWQLLDCSEEEKAAYAVVTALHPKNSRERYKRERIYGLACARRSLEEFLKLPDWEYYIDYFLYAKLWLAFPEALLERVQTGNVLSRYWYQNYNPIGQVILGKRRNSGDIPRLVALVEDFCQQRRESADRKVSGFAMVSGGALNQTLPLLERYAPAELRQLLPELLVIVCLRMGDSPIIVELVAQLLILSIQLQCDTTVSLLPLKEKLKHNLRRIRARRLVRLIRLVIPGLTSEPEIALRLMRVFRLVVIARRIEEAPPAQARRVQYWLTRSQRFIDSVEFPFWREQLQEKLYRLQKGAP